MKKTTTKTIKTRPKSDRKKPRRGVRRRGEHWYELVDYWNPDDITRISPDEPVFLMGMIEGPGPDVIVVEVPEDTTREKIERLGSWLSGQGIHALIVRAGIRFLRLKKASPEQTRKLDEHVRETAKRAHEARKEGEHAAAESASE